jgi:type II secretory pathway pseudopilin PulG
MPKRWLTAGDSAIVSAVREARERARGYRPHRDDRGYAMATLLVALSVMAVVMAAAMPVWKQQVQREREAELIFRGQQYVHAIALFQRRNGPGSLPPNVTVLVEQRFLRKKYKDPVTSDDFQPLVAGQVAPGASTPGAGTSSSSPRPGGTTSSQPAGRGAATTSGPTSPAGPVGGVIGVVSKSTSESIRIYNGRSHYNEWAFIFTAPAQAPAAPAGAPGGAGRRGAGPGRGAPTGVPPPFGARGAFGAPGTSTPPPPARRGR